MKQIENIFSKTPTKSSSTCPNPKTPIILDKREKQSLILSNLIQQKANVKQEILQIGDYLISDTIIERKSYHDFIASIIDKRLFNQIQEMKKYPIQYLILEGFDFAYKSRLRPNAIRGAILSISKQIPIIYTENETDTVTFLLQIAKQQEKNKSESSIRQSKSSLSIEQQKQFILEGFPKIGPTMARSLLKKFNYSLKDIFDAPKEKLEKILNKEQFKNFTQLLK